MRAANVDRVILADRAAADPQSAPVARMSRAALRANAALLADAGIATVGLAADALGHGLDEVAAILDEAGLAADESGIDHAELLLGLVAGAAPVMRLRGTVLSVKPLRTGEGVSYGYLHRAAHDTRIALVVGGYAQGVVRALGGRASVTIAGERHRIVGRVAMDVCVVDVGEASVSRGDEAVFFGDPSRGEPGIAEWAAATGLSASELVTTVGLRASREWM